ncbi:MAG: hypothetical protein DI535_11230 [Citrobacter freundii]|nr:MAG: hypothetical protein DI535_11230 [Citrobacter freundii]
MRKISVLLMAAAFVLPFAVRAQDDKIEVTGSGNVVTRDVNVNSFSQLTVGGVFNVVLAQGNKEAVKVEAEDNLQDLITVNQSDNGLTVSMKKNVNIKKSKKMTVYITFKQLKSIDLKTVGNVTTTGTLTFDNLKMQNQSVGNVELKLAAQKLNLDNHSVGNLELEGKADDAVISNKSVGNLHAANFVVQTIDMNNDGIGNAEVNAEKNLKLRSGGLGKVRNKGNGTVTKTNKVVI